MGQEAENLLDDILETGASSRLVNPALEEHIVIGEDRFITVPPMLKKIAVQFDHNIETVTFDCPRYWDGHDMSKMKVYINFLTPNNGRGMYPADNVIVDATDDTIMHFDWTLSREVTAYKGNISFLVCVKAVDGNGNETNHWNSELNREMIISEGLECEESIVQEYPDLITQILLRLDRIGVELTFEDDGKGNVAINGISNLNNYCSKFSKERQYATGDYCMYLGVMYKAIYDIPPGNDWNDDFWIETTVAQELKECFHVVDDGKTLIASAITDMAVPTGANDTFQQMADNIRSIKTGVAAGGTAEVGDVTAGKTFINSTGRLLTGTSTAIVDLANLRVEHLALENEKNALQSDYDTVVSEKAALQASYDSLVANSGNVQAAYDEYKNAVVTGLQYSDLGVTTSTTAAELQAILLAEFPDSKPYTVDLSAYPITLNSSFMDINQVGDYDVEYLSSEGCYRVGCTDSSDAGGFATVGGDVKGLPTNNCKKVRIKYSTSHFTDATVTMGSIIVNGTKKELMPNTSGYVTFDITGDKVDLTIAATDATAYYYAQVRVSEIYFYNE